MVEKKKAMGSMTMDCQTTTNMIQVMPLKTLKT